MYKRQVYNYTFTDVAPGRYELIAGTDADNDFLICDPGEACGQYLTLDAPVEVIVAGDTQDLSFDISYVTVVNTGSLEAGVTGATQGFARSGRTRAVSR